MGLLHHLRSNATLAATAPSPLKIAFFGTDSFALHSLKALHRYASDNPAHVSRLDLITRPPKLAGRGLNVIKDAATAEYASASEKYKINVLRAETSHEIESLAANDYNLAVAVSYGQLIPQKFLASLRFGGLNVHPSLLPELRGAAPIHWALLRGMTRTGVSVQTLHPTKFDHGQVICQSNKVPINNSVDTIASIREKLAVLGSELLVHVISNRLYETVDLGQQPSVSNYKPSFARKITPNDMLINLNKDSVESILTKNRVLGRLFLYQTIDGQEKRVFVDNLQRVTDATNFDHLSLGEYVPVPGKGFFIKAKDGIVQSPTLMLQGYTAQSPEQFEKSRRKRRISSTMFTTNS